VQPATIFEVASLGKPLFAYVVVQRALAGVVDLDRAVDAYLDEELARDPQTGRITYLTC
jgi:CubicO group peptidase (beta-lactamase class C family)